jgi:hypothetical protein
VGAVREFRRMLFAVAGRHPAIAVRYYYVTQASTDSIHDTVHAKVERLSEEVAGLLQDAECRFEFVGARELRNLAYRPPTQSVQLQLAEQASSVSSAAYSCLVRLADYYRFITHPDGRCRYEMFEENVRDYQRGVKVNKEIAESLAAPDQNVDFWWLNNGATVIATRISLIGTKVLVLDDPRVVNGLQTSQEVFKHFSEHAGELTRDTRNILVKVIQTDDERCRDRIIRATNSQTAVSEASLRATDKFQRDIEAFLDSRGLYYDRRKNQHRNAGRPIAKIISISYLAQAIASVLFSEPDNARARPSTLMKDDRSYRRIFNRRNPLQVYHTSVTLMRRVDGFLRSTDDEVSPDEKTNLRFYLAMCAAMTASRRPRLQPKDLIDLAMPSDLTLGELFGDLRNWLSQYVDERVGAPDRARATKSREFRDRVIALCTERLDASQAAGSSRTETA